jgi:hypothetical protein
MSKLSLALLAATMLFIGMFCYVLNSDTKTTQQGIDLLLIFSIFYGLVFIVSCIFGKIEESKTLRFSKRNGFYSLLILVFISLSSCASKSK